MNRLQNVFNYFSKKKRGVRREGAKRRVFLESLENRQLLAAFELAFPSGAEAAGMAPHPDDGRDIPVYEVGAGTSIAVEVSEIEVAVGGYQLNFSATDSELVLTDYVNNAVFLLATDAGLDTGAGDSFVSAAALPPNTVPSPAMLGSLTMTVPSTIGESFLLTLNDEPDGPFSSGVNSGATPAENSGDVWIRIKDPNTPPTAVDDTANLNEDTNTSIDVTGNDTDAETPNDLTIMSVSDPANGTATIVGGNVRYTPDANYNGNDSFTYVVADGNDATASATVRVTVDPVADDPNAVDDSPTTLEDAAVTVNVLNNDSDPDGGSLTIDSVTTPSNGSAVIQGSSVRYTPDADFNGSDSFDYVVSNAGGATATATVNVTIVARNDAPEAQDDTAVAAPDTAVDIDVLANDTDVDGDDLSITISTPASNGTAAVVGGLVRYTPNAGFAGQDAFRYTIDDGNGGSDSAGVEVIVDLGEPPVGNDDQAAGNEDQDIVIPASQLLSNDTDPDDGDVLSVTSVGDAVNGTVSLDGDNVVFRGDQDFNGQGSFTYRLTDRAGNTDTASVTVVVAPVNDAPGAVDDAFQTIEDASTTDDPAANDTDVDGDALTVISVAGATNGSATVNGDGTVTFTPAAGYNGPASYSYTVSDGNGGTDSGTANVTVLEQNDPPIANNDSANTDEDTSVSVDVLANDSDPDGDDLSISIVSASNGSAVVNNGMVDFTPDANYNGNATVRYQVTDGIFDSNIATVSITVDAVNDAPSANNDLAGTTENTPVDVAVLANDSDPENDPLLILSTTDGAKGTTTVVGSSVRYTPASNENGEDSFEYTISDGNGGQATATVAVRITDTNSAPIARNDTGAGDEDTSISVDVLSNDSDPDGDSLLITIVGTTNGSASVNNNGTPSPDDDSIDFTPTPDFNGNATVQYRVSDGITNSNIATAVITVNAVNDDPTANDDSFTAASSSGPVDLDVLGNDSSAPDSGEALTITDVQSASGSSVSTDGTVVTYEPAAGLTGFDEFTYTISDGNGGTDSATASVVVSAQRYFRDGDDLIFLGTEGRDSIIVQNLTFDNLNIFVRTTGGNFGPLPMADGGSLFIFGAGGNDVISISGNLKANVVVDAGAGNDRIAGGSGDDILMGGPGNDEILGGAGDNQMYGGDGNDRLIGRDGNEMLDGGAGNDILLASSGNDILIGGEGRDHLSGGGGMDILQGGDGDDELDGGISDDLLSGDDGNDSLKGNSGDDVLIGGLGVDGVNGSRGEDALAGGTTALDTAGLAALLADWSNASDLSSRIAAVSGQLTDEDDGDTDNLIGGGAADWFVSAGDSMSDFKASKDQT